MDARLTSNANRFAYGAGHALISAKNMLFHFFFLFYFSNVLGIPEWQVLTATFIAILIDAVSDPAMGQISDSTRSARWGRRHGWLLLGTVPTAAALALLFSPPPGMSALALFSWMFVFMVVTRLAITLYTVPYFALVADMTRNYNERTTLSAFRSIFENVFNLIVFILGFLVFLPDRDGLEDGMLYEPGYAPFALSVGIIGVLGGLVLVWGTWDKVETTQPATEDVALPWYGAFSGLVKAFGFREFRTATIAYSILITLYGTISQLSLYVGVYLWQFSQVQKLVASIIPFIVIIPAAIFAGWMAKRTDKRDAALKLTWAFGVSFSLPFALYLLGLTPPEGSTALLLLIGVTSGIGYAGFIGTIILSYSMLADVTDLITLRTGRQQEALIFAGFTFANKLAFAGGLVFATMGIVIIDLPEGALPSQVEGTTTAGLAAYSIVVNMLLMGAAWTVYRRYTLTREAHAMVRKSLSAL